MHTKNPAKKLPMWSHFFRNYSGSPSPSFRPSFTEHQNFVLNFVTIKKTKKWFLNASEASQDWKKNWYFESCCAKNQKWLEKSGNNFVFFSFFLEIELDLRQNVAQKTGYYLGQKPKDLHVIRVAHQQMSVKNPVTLVVLRNFTPSGRQCKSHSCSAKIFVRLHARIVYRLETTFEAFLK